jgi:hypothetical protein
MPDVNQFVLQALEDLPDYFTEKAAAKSFLECKEGIERRQELALHLLEHIAEFSECPETWRTLVKDRLVAAEKAMRYLLPAHRDHVLHSALLYLLGLAIYSRVIRKDAALVAVIADGYFRDLQALFGTSLVPFSCFPSLTSQTQPLSELRSQLPETYHLVPWQIRSMLSRCQACSPSELAGFGAFELSECLKQYSHCCGPGGHISEAVSRLARAIEILDSKSLTPEEHYPKTLADVDAIFRRRWGQAAILHDAAYPMQLAAKQLDEYVQGAVRSLGCSVSPCSASFGIGLNCLCDFVTIPLIQNVCSQRLNPHMYTDNSVALLAANLCHKLHVEYSPATLGRILMGWLEADLGEGRLDHGVFSALLMLRRVNHEIVNRLGNQRQASELLRDNDGRRVTDQYAASAVEFFYIECVDAASAVYLHNAVRFVEFFNSRRIDYRDHPFAWLLFLCDQLQEWLRPSGESVDEPLKLFDHAKEYKFEVHDGPELYFRYPEKSDKIVETIRKHLRLFESDFIVCGG